ncbi:MAG TPA: peptidylprolyl isomerase [Vicinamibacteria bacterium]|jgi:peptidyl-prolyl cis-trans isomerase B (cyclophilin B)
MALVRLLAVLGLVLTPLAAANASAQENPIVVIETSMGNITVELNQARAPRSVENFLGYVKDGFYDGTIFHRVISNFMIQGGGFTADMEKKPTRDPIQNEADNSLKNDRGTLAMARTGEIHSATAQFFINVRDNDFLNYQGDSAQDYGYAVFGRVTDGMDVVDKIKDLPTGTIGGMQDVPTEKVIIKTIRVQEAQ